jgi:hypothetical protein
MSTVFQDEIFSATDLNRRSGHILDEAEKRPVTIMRNEDAFALLPRKKASRLVDSAAKAVSMVELVLAAGHYRQRGLSVPQDHHFEWVNAFDIDDLVTMVDEVSLMFRRAASGELEWDEFDAVVHEWQESAWAARSTEIADAFSAKNDEVPLSAPTLTAGTISD